MRDAAASTEPLSAVAEALHYFGAHRPDSPRHAAWVALDKFLEGCAVERSAAASRGPLKTRTVVQVWTCGDDVCDCEQAEVVRIEPNLAIGAPFVRTTRIDEGPFYTDGEGWIDGKVHADAEALAEKHGLGYDRG